MTISGNIMRGVANLTRHGKEVFTRQDVRLELGVDSHDWNQSYNPTFQGMRVDQPGGAPDVGERFKGVFRRVAHGKYKLTEYGQQLVGEF